MASPIKPREACLQLKSNSLDGAMMRGAIMSASTTGTLELDRSFQHPLGLHPHANALQSSTSWSSAQHLNENQAGNENPLDCQGVIKQSFLVNKRKSSGTSDEDESSWKETTDEHHGGKGKRTCPWQRIKWTDDMVKFLINTVNLVGEDAVVDNLDGNKKVLSILQKKGKWRSVSNAMNEGGWYVSPQQCEDKFNDLNKRYKRLNDILGRDVALAVTENPGLLDNMGNLSAKRKDDVKKVLSSKHSFYKEMHLYHSGLKSPAPLDFQFSSSIQSFVLGERCGGVEITRSMWAEDTNKDGANMNVPGDVEDNSCDHQHPCHKRHEESKMDGCNVDKGPSFSWHAPRNCGAIMDNAGKETMKGLDINCKVPQVEKLSAEQLNMLRCRMMQLEEFKVGLHTQALEIEKQWCKWQKLMSKKNGELKKMREENERMKLENNQLTFQLKQKELEVECKRSVASMTLFELLLEKLRSKERTESMQGQGYG